MLARPVVAREPVACHALARAVAAFLVGIAAAASTVAGAQESAPRVPARTILAIGAHAGDMELTTGAVLAGARQRGDRVVLLHLTLGEGGNPALSPAAYGDQKRREALAVGAALGAEVRFAPYRDGELPDDDAARRYVADVIREVRPTHVFTHWKDGMHKDHIAASAIARDAVLLASLAGVVTDHPAWRGVRAVWYADNWEDAPGFAPFVYVAVGDAFETWRSAVVRYEFVGGRISSFPYLDYYTALATVRGAVAGKGRAVSFAIEPFGQRRVLDSIP
ncbi:MAG: PIG-L family deacetylase [Gemmatimonadetes bacterium]|nr:PIG-L family deacetylase [Gemmatimonadota bacterium]